MLARKMAVGSFEYLPLPSEKIYLCRFLQKPLFRCIKRHGVLCGVINSR
jgi:hypothetical protein